MVERVVCVLPSTEYTVSTSNTTPLSSTVTDWMSRP